jgi:hypothetical protein
MKLKLLLILTFSVFASVASAQERDFIGYEHKGVVFGEKLPNGFKDLGGGLLSDEDYGVTRFARGKKHYLWLEKITGRDRQGVPRWVVLDVLEFGALRKNQEFLFSYSSTCTIDGEGDQDLIVFAEQNTKTKKYKVLKAWRANVETEKFEKLSIKGIRCEAEKPTEQFADY